MDAQCLGYQRRLSYARKNQNVKKAFDVYQANRQNQKDICPNSCLFTNMYFGPLITGNNPIEQSDIARGIFYFRRDIKTTSEYLLYSFLSMIAEIGGYVGLLLGASLVDIGKINNFLIDKCFPSPGQREQVRKPKITYVLSRSKMIQDVKYSRSWQTRF